MSNQPPSEFQPDGTQPPPSVPYPAPPAYQPGSAAVPQPQPPQSPQPPQPPQPAHPAQQQEAYHPPTAQFPPVAGHDPFAPGPAAYGPPAGYQPGYQPGPPPPGNQPGYQPGYQPGPPPPPRRSNLPIVAVIIAVALLLCGGVATAGVLIAREATDRAKEAVDPIVNPTLPALPTEAPDIPGLPTEVPTDLPDFPGGGRTIEVVYEVTGDGPADIVYTEKLGDGPKRVTGVKLPWKLKATTESPALVSVTAVRTGTDEGQISCSATVDGEEVAQKSREGAFATASCVKMVLQ